MTIAYRTMHEFRLKTMRGKASEYTCKCGKPAKQWAYQHTGETLYSPEGRAYSENLDDYEAMCISCHIKLDITSTPDRFLHLDERRRKSRRKTSRKPLSERFVERVNKRRRCLECGKETTLGALGSHQRYSGHIGFEDID